MGSINPYGIRIGKKKAEGDGTAKSPKSQD